jgi:hypothetical protein
MKTRLGWTVATSFGSIGALAAVLFLPPATAVAQKKESKEAVELARAREKIQRLEREILERDRRIAELVRERRLEPGVVPAGIVRQSDYPKSKTSHTIFSEVFNLDSSFDSEKAAKLFADANKSLPKIEGVRSVFVGRASTNSDTAYEYELVVLLDPGTPTDRLIGSDGYKALQAKYAKSQAYNFTK